MHVTRVGKNLGGRVAGAFCLIITLLLIFAQHLISHFLFHYLTENSPKPRWVIIVLPRVSTPVFTDEHTEVTPFSQQPNQSADSGLLIACPVIFHCAEEEEVRGSLGLHLRSSHDIY